MTRSQFNLEQGPGKFGDDTKGGQLAAPMLTCKEARTLVCATAL